MDAQPEAIRWAGALRQRRDGLVGVPRGTVNSRLRRGLDALSREVAR